MRYTIPLLSGLLVLAACGKSEPPPPPTPMPVQTAPAPPPAPMPAAAPASDPMPAPIASTPAPTDTAAAPAPATMVKPGGGASGGSHVVASGDTLYSIAKANGVSVDDLMKWNQIDDPRRLFVGKQLTLGAPTK